MLNGIDVSNWQGQINWEQVAKAGCHFAFVKATEGATYTDPAFARNRKEAASWGIALGAYHYFRASSTVADQAANFIRNIGRLTETELPPVLDFEDPKQWKDYEKSQLTERTLEWLAVISAKLDCKPLIYTSPSFVEAMLDQADVRLANYPLWLAHWTENEPRVPAPWTTWTFWQYSSKGRMPGIDGYVDLDRYHGNPEALKVLRTST